MAVINKVTLPSEDLYDVQTLSIPFGQVDSTSTATAFTATIPGITSLYDGVCVYLKNGVITSASGWTLDINGLGAKPVYQTQAAASRTTTIFNVAYTALFVYNSSRVDDGCWDYFYGYNSDTNTTAYQIRGNQATLKMYAALTRYKVCFSRFDGTLLPSTATSNSTGTSKTLTTESFDPHGLIYYYSTTTGVAAGEFPGASYMWIYYPTVDLRYGFNTGNTLVVKEPVYIQCNPQDDGSFKLSGNDCIVQELPSTDDGYAYIYLGKAYDTYRMAMDLHHPIYCYKNGAIVQWGSDSGSTPDWDENDSTSDAYVANRTHYRTSLGSMSNLHPLIPQDGNWNEQQNTGQSGNTYGFVGTWEFDFNNDYDSLMSDFPDGSITLLDLENPEIVVIADGTELELTYVKKPITDSEYSIYVFYNSDFEISYADGNNGYIPEMFRIASNTAYQSIEIKLKTSTEIFEYHTLDDRYLNGGLIKSGTGTQSEIFNKVIVTEGYQLHITGEADAVEYDFESVPIPLGLSFCCSAIKVEGHDDIEVVALYGLDDDLTQNAIRFNKTFDADNALEDYPITIIAPSRIASGHYSHLEGSARYALGLASHAEGDGTTASGYASHTEGNSTVASGSSSHAEGQFTTASGSSSHAEGDGTTASSDYSHAEGYNSTASGYMSHAEGTNTTASGDTSHAEGEGTTASGETSHAEGDGTTASGSYSHAEGSGTTASGIVSHSEGQFTTASGSSSHAEGSNTVAQRRSQHVFGEFNVLDNTGTKTSAKGSYIEIVGNGTATTARSNARTLDWSGNEVLAGKLTVGAAPTNNMDVTTKQYVDNSISTAITDINSFNTAIVQSLPTTDIDTHTIYFISNSGSGTNVYDEYIYINNNWEKIGSTSIDLSNYLAKDNTTSYTPTGDYHPATKKYVDDNAKDLFVVNITSTTTEGVTTYSADKTFAEITAAYNAGKLCICKYSGYIHQLYEIYSTDMNFSRVTTSVVDTAETIYVSTVKIDNTNTITVKSRTAFSYHGSRNVHPYKEQIAKVNATNYTLANLYKGIVNYNTTTATQAYSVGDLFWLNFNVLAKATTDITSGATLTENTNYVKTTIADELKNAVSGGGGSSTLVDLTDTTITSPTNGQTLVYNSTASKWENQDSNFVVTITYSGSGDNITYTADKTFDATYEAYTSGKRIYAVLASAIYILAGATSSMILFSRSTESTLTVINWSKSSNTITRSNKVVTLVNLTDTTINSPTNGQVLMYNSTTSKWENTSLPIYNGGVSS